MVDKKDGIIWATGRRKTSVAQIRMIPNGEGKYLVNKKTIEDFFGGNLRHIHNVKKPMGKIESAAGYDIRAKVHGGGITGQAEAIRHGIARALAKLSDANKLTMRKEGFLTRDDRKVERKKPGQPKARKRFQYSKR